MRPYTVNLNERDIETLRGLAAKNDLPPGVFARVLLLRALRKELENKENETGAGCLTSEVD